MSVWKMVAGVAAGAVLAAGAADAAVVTVNFSGVVSTAGAGASLGSTFSGSFSYEQTAAPVDVAYGAGGALATYMSLTDLNFTFDGISGTANSAGPIGVQDYLPGSGFEDGFVIFSHFGPSSALVRLRLFDSASTAFSTYDLPTVIDFASFDFGTLTVGSTDNDIVGTLDGLRITAVPEPATWAMMIAGFGLAGASLRRRRRLVGQG